MMKAREVFFVVLPAVERGLSAAGVGSNNGGM